MRVLIVLMTRVPIPGKTKTRLMPPLTGEECAGLQRAFIEDLIDLLRDDLKLPACILFTPEDKDGILRNIVKDRLPLVLQRGETLGDR
ncbi:MAG TPA: glycosyltransferase, partial [Firmicutes bacterium]|nr:glycosyltransferase [Bacillota bacterium]